MQLERALASLATGYLARESADPPLHGRAETRRSRDHAPRRRLDKRTSFRPGDVEVVANGPKPRLAIEHETDRVLTFACR